MRLLTLVFAFCIWGSGFTPVVWAEDATPTMSAEEPQWREVEQDAASFAVDWLISLDGGDFSAAAAAFTRWGGDPEPTITEKKLAGLRNGCGEFSERSFLGSHVFAVAHDNSEQRIRVRYHTQFANKTVEEVTEVLLVQGKDPVVTDYRLEPAGKAPN